MITDQQTMMLFKELALGKTLAVAAARSGMSERTARRYKKMGKLPSEVMSERTWRTREDPFKTVWDEVVVFLESNPKLEAQSIFDYLQRKHPGKFQDGQVRTFQRHIKFWRATEGPSKEVFFAQVHEPGKLGQSDFTHMTKLGVRIGGQLFAHMVYHFVLTYSNWETFTICFSESFESLSEGLQNALWELGSVPKQHVTDRLSAAVNNISKREEFTRRYQALIDHYGFDGNKTNVDKAHEKGDVEQSHYRFRKAVDQALMLRGSRDFGTRDDYEKFLRKVTRQLNHGRRDRLEEELTVLRPLPKRRLESYRRLTARVRDGSLISVDHNTYSVHSRLVGEKVKVRLYAEYLEVWYGQKRVETIPRMRGRGKHFIQYRHIIDWLVRKPGAFENYRYREDMFPTSRFRVVYDALKEAFPKRADRYYLEILHLAARESESAVDDSIRFLLNENMPITPEAVKEIVVSSQQIPPPTDIPVDPVDLKVFDELYTEAVVV